LIERSQKPSNHWDTRDIGDVLFELDAEKITNRCPPASPEFAMAGRLREPCIILSPEGSRGDEYLRTKKIGGLGKHGNTLSEQRGRHTR